MAALIFLGEQSSILASPRTTHPQQIVYCKKQAKTKISSALIKSIAADKYEDTFEGITYLDLCKGKYKVVDTEEQARNILHYHKTKGTLFSNYPITIPQQYYATQDQASTAGAIQEYRAREVPYHPTGGTALQPDISPKKVRTKAIARRYNISRTYRISYSQYSFKDIEESKARSFNEVMECFNSIITSHAAAERFTENSKIGVHTQKSVNPQEGSATTQVKTGVGGWGLGDAVRVRVGIHKILIHLQVYEGKASEAYYERLHDVPPDADNNSAKVLETAIEIANNHYLVKASVFPNGKIIVDVPCSANPFPLWLQDHEKTNKDFLCLLTNIRAFLQDCTRDSHSTIIPPTHNPAWRVKNCDIKHASQAILQCRCN